MSDSGTEPATATAGEGIQQIPAVIQVTETPVAADARDKLLQAIGQEAQLVADKSPGQASKPLEELARAFALVAGTGAPLIAEGGNVAVRGDARRAILYPENWLDPTLR
ncbi:hypothetical protein [Streptomyces sp. NPDC002215]|uniref:hypothetical protein n=1 Tax=Streptomyces sp. NPDC002215 TaxID=3154412 RepID=UPI003326D964